ncbi:phosphoglycerate mutase [Companilactobacillus sp. RD055328]|uniref:histidine phosphatase family protein n=1 Tax=Companilactobacillus sp. RD055328 TaxID=2916634 RepID=UPI001FC81C67|nr:histidine phosphatase family protein [Companilactobacillus sp. RD055328]GKQ43283.1 phosphoglycerate mutase [Companilactobacillus sp. RD055328]
MVEVYIIRHGQTDTNKEKRINGNSTDLPLNATGRQQASQLRESFDLSDFDEVISSPLIRAYETAQIVTESTGIEVKTDARLREADYGSWDGKSETELFAKYPQTFDNNGYLLPNYIEYAENAEDYEDVYARIDELLNEISQLGDDKKVALVCHGFISRALMKVILGVDDISKIIQPKNCGVSKYRLTEAGQRHILYYARIAPANFE